MNQSIRPSALLVMTTWALWGAASCMASRVPEGGAAPPAAAASTPPPPVASGPLAWPPGKKAAVSLTYDDALASQLANAGPALKRHHLHGTFFVTENAQKDAAGWSALQREGHELASHTMRHPCERSQPWVPKGGALEDYDLARMQAELEESMGLLKSLGARQGPYTFAYPCGATWVGEKHESYVPLVKQLFVAARGVGAQDVDASTETLEDTSAIPGDRSAEELVALAEAAEKRGTWLVLLFHGVGGDYLEVSSPAHEALLAYLEQHSALWVDTFLSVSTYVRQHRLGTAVSHRP